MKKKIALDRLPLRECRSLYLCCLCKFDIRIGDLYHDGGYKHRAHVMCVRDLVRRSR